MAKTELLLRLKEIQNALVHQQGEKIRYVNLINDRGFLTVELLAENPEKKTFKIGLVQQAIVKMSDAIKRQQILIRNINLDKISIALGNEKAILKDLSRASQANNVQEMVEKIEELDAKINQTMGLIRSIFT